MPTYTYRARGKQGELFASSMDAGNETEVASNLRSLGYSIITIEEESQAKKTFSDFWQRIRKTHIHELIFFSRQLALLLRSGIPLAEGLSSIAEQTKSTILKKAIDEVLKDVESGLSLSEALAKYPNVFPELFVSMVKVGETTGNLDEILERLAQLKSQESDVKMRIKSALTYPAVLVCVAVILVSFLLIHIIPKFVTIFEAYDAQLPLATRIMLGASFLVRRLWYLVLAAVIASIVWYQRYVRTEHGRYKVDFFILRLPLFGQLYLKIVIARFARTLSGLIKSGTAILEALSVTEKTVQNSVVTRVIQGIQSAITEGQPLTEPFKASGIFPPTVIQMVSVGEKSGNLDQMLSELASFYDQEVDYTIKNITTALEPLLLVAIGALVAFIALSVLLPIFNLIKIFRT